MKNQIIIQSYEDVDKSLYDYQKDHTKEFIGNYNAYQFFGNNISYKEADNSVEKMANYLQNVLKVKPGEVVAVIAPGLPEVGELLYSISKNGATYFGIDPRNSAATIKDFLNLAEVKHIFMFDQAFVKVDSIIDQTKVEDVTVLSVKDSMKPIMWKLFHTSELAKSRKKNSITDKIGVEDLTVIKEQIARLNGKDILTKEDQKMIKKLKVYEDILLTAAKNLYYTNPPKTGYIDLENALTNTSDEYTFDSIYDNNIPATITLTSGTTGTPKVVPTYARSYNVKVRDYANTTMPISVGDKMLAMPPFIMYGEVFMHMAYIRGVQNVIIPDITRYAYSDIILKNRINHVVGVPSQALQLAENEKAMKKIAPFVKTISVGGNKMLLEHEQIIDNAFQKNGSDVVVTQGYSMTELTPSSFTNTPGHKKQGSVGQALGDTNAIIINEDTNEILGPNEKGLLLINSETMFKGYYKNPLETEKVFRYINGVKYVETGDIAYYDDDNYYYIVDRKKHSIIRPDGHNNFPSEMEEVIVNDPAVEDCAVVGYPYPDYQNPTGYYPKAHIVLKEEYKGLETEVEARLKKTCLEKLLSERDVPYYYEFHDSLPLTPVFKPDKIALMKMDEEEMKTKQKVKTK